MNYWSILTRCGKFFPKRKSINFNAMKQPVHLNDITIRTGLRPGDIGNVVWLHGHLYGVEYNYGVAFEAYVAMGMYEFYRQYDAACDRVWICEYENKMVGFLLLMHREDSAAQLR